MRWTYSSIRALKSLNLGTQDTDGGGCLLLGELVRSLPELIVLLAEEHDAARASHVEGGRGVLKGVVHDFEDAVIGDG